MGSGVGLRRPVAILGAIWQRHALTAAGILVLAIGAIGTGVKLVADAMDARYATAGAESEHLASAYDRELAMHADFVLMLATHLQMELEDQLADEDLGEQLRLTRIPGTAVFGTSRSESSTAAIGRITGLGAIPDEGAAALHEMEAASNLTPICRVALQRNPDLPWCYYLSVNRFVYLFPYSDDPQSFFSDAMLEGDFFALAAPARNPSGGLVWADLYRDLAGRGWMTTVSHPISQDGEFLGVVAVDIRLETLDAIRASIPVVNSSTWLYDANGTSMHGRPTTIGDRAWTTLTQGAVVEQDGMHIRAQRIASAGWWLLTATDIAQVRAAAVLDTAPSALAALLIFVSLGLVWALGFAWRRMRRLAVHDGLTGLENRRSFDAYAASTFAHVQRSGGQIGLAIVDIDNFKAYNDEFGHVEGDRALRAVAQTMRESLRRATDHCFRLGGEEFAVITGLGDQESLDTTLEHVRLAVRDLAIPHPGSNARILTVSIGAVLLTRNAWQNVDHAYRCADSALYRAKAAGRDTCIIDSVERE